MTRCVVSVRTVMRYVGSGFSRTVIVGRASSRAVASQIGGSRMIRILNLIVIGALLLLGAVSPIAAQEPLVQIYLVRHPETDPTPSDSKAIHLTDAGRQRAALLVPTFAAITVTHL